jgi:hypothetical protein
MDEPGLLIAELMTFACVYGPGADANTVKPNAEGASL